MAFIWLMIMWLAAPVWEAHCVFACSPLSLDGQTQRENSPQGLTKVYKNKLKKTVNINVIYFYLVSDSKDELN